MGPNMSCVAAPQAFTNNNYKNQLFWQFTKPLCDEKLKYHL